MRGYLESARKQFRHYQALGEKSLLRMNAAQLAHVPGPGSNSIAVIIRHLYGNMMSRWTRFLTEDGEKAGRNRDAEFDAPATDPETILQQWNEGWNCLFSALDDLTDADLGRTVRIRGEAHTVLEAINRQLTHYAYHVGQIVYLAKMLQGTTWESLSIPRGGSAAYNATAFGQAEAGETPS